MKPVFSVHHHFSGQPVGQNSGQTIEGLASGGIGLSESGISNGNGGRVVSALISAPSRAHPYPAAESDVDVVGSERSDSVCPLSVVDQSEHRRQRGIGHCLMIGNKFIGVDDSDFAAVVGIFGRKTAGIIAGRFGWIFSTN